MALGIGGVPKGRIVEIYGPESSGKTTLALHIVASGQKRGGEAAFIDAEHALDPTYAQALGVTSTACSSPSRTPASRRWRSPRRWCAPAPSTSWSSTPSPPWCPGRDRGRDGRQPSWACRPG
jgi:RecA/RadA recombinase